MRLTQVARNTTRGRKGFSDFQREQAAFEERKRQRQMQEQQLAMDQQQAQQGLELGELKKQALEQKMNAPDLPFEGSGFDAQIANEAYRFNLNKGMSDAEARQNAIDMVLGTKSQSQTYTDPYTGQTVVQQVPRQPIFGQESARTPGFNPQQPVQDIPGSGSQEEQLGKNMPGMNLPAPNKQTAESGALESQMNIDPRAMRAPDVQKSLAETAGEYQLKEQDPEFLLERQAEQRKLEEQEAKLQEAEEKKALRQDQQAMTNDIMTQDINRVLNIMEQTPYPATGTIQNMFSGISESAPGRISKMLDTIKANAAFDRLDQMRQSSPTGGAVGQLSDSERQALADTRGSLTVATSPQDLDYNLKRLYNLQMDYVHGKPEEIKRVAAEKGLNQEQINKLSFRYPLQEAGRTAQRITIEEFLAE